MKLDFPICTYSPNLPLAYRQQYSENQKIVIHNLLISYLLSVYYVLGGRQSIVKVTNMVFLIVYLPSPLAKG